MPSAPSLQTSTGGRVEDIRAVDLYVEPVRRLTAAVAPAESLPRDVGIRPRPAEKGWGTVRNVRNLHPRHRLPELTALHG